MGCSALIRVAVLSLAAMATTGHPSGALAAEAAKKPVTIGMILEARPDVEPWSAAWYDAAEALKKADTSIKVLYSYDAFDAARAEPVARQMLDSGANVMALTTFVLSDVSKALAPEYKSIPMLVASFGVMLKPNLSSVTASYLEMGYSSCWLLAKLSKDARIGVVGAQGAPFETEQFVGCQLGAAAANPATKITLVNTNSFTDTQANREQVKGLIDKGITNINLMSGTEDALGGLRMCESSGAFCTTWGGDARKWAPTTSLTVVLDWSGVLKEQVEQARSGTMEAKSHDLTYKNGGLRTSDLSKTKAISPDLKTQFEAMLGDLASEKIALPESKAHPGLR